MGRFAAAMALVLCGLLSLLTASGLSFSLAPSSSLLPSSRLPSVLGRVPPKFPGARRSSGGSWCAGTAGLAATGVAFCWALAAHPRSRRSSKGVPAARQRTASLRALPEAAELARQAQEHLLASDPSLAELASLVQHWADAVASELGVRAAEAAHAAPALLDPWPAAYAADAPELDPNTKYIFGPDGNVLIDPMSNKPIPDDWWNGFIGFQAGLIKALDEKLREAGVIEAFGWSIVIYTIFVKVLFYPLQQSQLKSTSMMQLLSPKVKEIQERYKNDPETMQRLLGQLYSAMDVNPLGGCLPLFLQIPLFWSLYGAWRRLSAEKFPHYSESWLWVPSLSQPNPDFQFKLDWMWQFKDGAPAMGWHDYLCYLIFPTLLVAFTVISQKQTQAARSQKDQDENTALVMQVLPWISVYFIGTLSLELPQAVSVYYATNTALTLGQTSLVKFTLRQEIPGYEEYERTGKFPDSAFDEAVMATTPAPQTLHEAALRGNVDFIRELYEGDASKGIQGGQFDINAWDEKEIAPIGYAVACGHLAAVRYFIEKGANLQVTDGQKNTLLHYAAGYGHMEVLEEILSAGAALWPDNEWAELRNAKGQSVMDAARVNRKGGVLDFLSERLGIETTVVNATSASTPAGTGPEGKAEEKSPAANARAALLAAAGTAEAEGPATTAGAPSAEALKSASTIRDAISKLKENPEAVEQARKMMSKMPPQLLTMLSGNKLSAEQAQKAMEKMQDMSTEDILANADGAAAMLGKGAAAPGSKGAPAATPKPAPERSSAPARAID